MNEVRCPQCEKPLTTATCRLVQDACGHKKCRMCLLQDEESCYQCKQQKDTQTSVITKKSSIDVLNKCDSVTIPNHVSIKGPSGEVPLKEVVEPSNSGVKSTVKTAKKAEMNAKKRSYQTIVIPNHISVLKDPVSYKCNLCSKMFVTKSHIKYHVYCKGGECSIFFETQNCLFCIAGSKPYRCDVCNKEFITKSHLEIHMFIHVGSKPYTCTICSKSFTLRSKLNRHKLLHTTAKPYICQQCGKSFRSKESLKIHNFVHSGEKPYKCTQCSAKFNNSSNLNKHLVTHSSKTAVFLTIM